MRWFAMIAVAGCCSGLFRALPAAAQTAAAPAAAADAAPSALHVPIHEAFTGEAELRFKVLEPDRVGAIMVSCLARAGGARVHGVQARRAADGYRARLPFACVKPPGFGYWVSLRGADGREQPLFAAAGSPHPVRVIHTPERERELRLLRAHGYKRSRLVAFAEGVDFGDRRAAPDGPTIHDRYYRLEAGYGYAFYGVIEDIGLTLVRVRGQTSALDAAQAARLPLDPGIDYGRATVTLRLVELVRARGSLLLGASQEGFEYGVSSELVLGDPLAEHLLVGVESLTTLGDTGYLRLGFNATPTIPMGARVELTDFPLGEDAAVRLLYEIGYRFAPDVELSLRGGYQGRTSVVGGPSLGVTMRYGF